MKELQERAIVSNIFNYKIAQKFSFHENDKFYDLLIT